MFWVLSKNLTINDLLIGNALSDLKAKIELTKKQKKEKAEEMEKVKEEEIKSISEVTISMTSYDLSPSNFHVIHTSLPDISTSNEAQHESEY